MIVVIVRQAGFDCKIFVVEPAYIRQNLEMKSSVEVVNDQKSQKAGAAGYLETILRRFKNISFAAFIMPIAALYVICLGTAFLPGVLIVGRILEATAGESLLYKSFCLSLGLGAGFLTFVFTLILVVPLVNLPIRPFVKPFRGAWYSFEAVPWFYHNALFYLVRYTVLNLFTPSPINQFFLRAMGMKIGKNALVNTANISDPCLIEVGDYVTLGGSVYMMAHYGMKGFLIVDRLKIEKGANIGLHSYLMGAVEVGEFATVLPNSMVLPKTKIAPYTRFGRMDGPLESTGNE